MNHYLDLPLEDFVWDEAFRSWVLTPTDEDDLKWQKWLNEHPEKAATVSRARELVIAISPKNHLLSSEEKQAAIHQILYTAQQSSGKRSFLSEKSIRTYTWLAASVLILIAISWITFENNPSPKLAFIPKISFTDQEPATYLNSDRTPRTFGLADGSVITLEPQSSVTMPANFGNDNRTIVLTGKAFFDIKKDPDHPFLVYAGETVTRVLGTSFSIDARADAPEIVVTVITGKVSVFKKQHFNETAPDPQKTGGVILSPNQQAVFLKEYASLSKKLVESPAVVTVPGSHVTFLFDNTPLKNVFEQLEEAYGVEIVYNPDLKNRTLTVNMEDEPLYEKLDIICKTMKLSYRIRDARIYIYDPDNSI